MSTMKIYIPTYKRVDKQITYNALPKKYKKKVIMVVQKQEEKLYKEKYDCKFEIVNNNIGLSKTRKHIFKISQGKRFCIIDDDVTFWRRNSKYVKEEQCGSLPDNELEPKMIKVKVKKDMEDSKREMNESDFDDMFKEFDEMFDNGDTFRPEQPIIQISCREQSKPPAGIRTRTNLPSYSFHYFNGKHIKKIFDKIDWDMVKVGQDTMWQLEFLLNGYQLRLSDIFCIKSLWWQEGGVSEYRDAKMFDEEHKKILKKWPAYCFITKRKVERVVGDLIDIRYRWRKAFKDGTRPKIKLDK